VPAAATAGRHYFQEAPEGLSGTSIDMAMPVEQMNCLCNGDRKEVLSQKDFLRLSAFIHTECGIKITEGKKVMIEARLQKRMRALGIQAFRDYCSYLFSPGGMEQERHHMIDVVTTNKTDFFREPSHFEFLVNTVLPELIAAQGSGAGKKLTVWSAGCSTGEEPYTLAMVINEFAGRDAGCGFTWSILATDISTKVLEKAKQAVFDRERVIPVPDPLKRKYLLKSKDRDRGLVRVVPELRKMVCFRRLNFMDDHFGVQEMIDVLFCRNVIIYFDRPTQERLLNKFCRQMVPGGYLFMGHSETLHGLNVPLVQVAPTVYRKPV
jgi:chemotaxis protein methyltransferase CheR